MNELIRMNAKATMPGTMTHHGYIKLGHKERMTGLHNPAWWSYIRLASLQFPDGQFRIRLLKSDGLPAFDNGSCEWTQAAGQTRYLPWAIPATMADTLGIYCEITCLETDAPTFVTRILGFHEMPHLSPYDRYLFVDETGHIKMAWAGQFRIWPEPAWGERHCVVTPLVHGDPASRHYYPTGWLERIEF